MASPAAAIDAELDAVTAALAVVEPARSGCCCLAPRRGGMPGPIPIWICWWLIRSLRAALRALREGRELYVAG